MALQRVLVPISSTGSYGLPLDHLGRLLRALGERPVVIRFLQVGPGPRAEVVAPPEWNTELVERDGEVVEVIAEEAAKVDLVVLATRGLASWSDRLWGSTTQQLLERLSTPVLTVVS
jgi:nucleotide-binding universal stress UspA family protein